MLSGGLGILLLLDVSPLLSVLSLQSLRYKIKEERSNTLSRSFKSLKLIEIS